MAISTGRQGMTKAKKKAHRLATMDNNRKRDKANWRSSYHSEFKAKNGKRGYPAGARPRIQDIGFLDCQAEKKKS